jgi:hypothetical protein
LQQILSFHFVNKMSSSITNYNYILLLQTQLTTMILETPVVVNDNTKQ